MEEEISKERISVLEKSIEQLNSLMELSFISNQYSEIGEFLNVLQTYIQKTVPEINIQFLYTTP